MTREGVTPTQSCRGSIHGSNFKDLPGSFRSPTRSDCRSRCWNRTAPSRRQPWLMPKRLLPLMRRSTSLVLILCASRLSRIQAPLIIFEPQLCPSSSCPIWHQRAATRPRLSSFSQELPPCRPPGPGHFGHWPRRPGRRPTTW